MWFEIGQVLGVPCKDLVYVNFPESYKLSSVLQHWIDQCTPEITWNTIIAAMKSEIIGQIEIGKNIRRHVLNINQEDLSHHESDITSRQSKQQAEVIVHEECGYHL